MPKPIPKDKPITFIKQLRLKREQRRNNIERDNTTDHTGTRPDGSHGSGHNGPAQGDGDTA
jgi:hypothetical protein